MTTVEASRFPIPVTKDSFAYRPGVVHLTELLRSVNYLQNVLPASVPLTDIFKQKHIDEKLITEGDIILAHNVARIFKLDASIDPTRFILSQLKAANEVTEYIRKTLNIPQGMLNDEIDMADPQILRTMVLHLRKTRSNGDRGDKKVSPKLSYELRRQLFLAVIAGRLHMSSVKNKPRELASELQYKLNKHFYDDERVGETTDVKFVTTHDPVTNEVTQYRESSGQEVLSANEKSALFHFRCVSLDGPHDQGRSVYVYSADRKKDDAGAIIKSIGRVKQGDIDIDPTKEVEDSIGKRFVVWGDDVLRDKFMEKYKRTIQQLYPDAIIVPDPPKVRKDEEAHRGQSDMTDYNRIKIYFKGSNTPYEVLCYTLHNFLNSKVHVGHPDEKGVYDGYAHDIYGLRRIAEVAKILFPQELYDYNIDELIQAAMAKKVMELREKTEIDYA